MDSLTVLAAIIYFLISIAVPAGIVFLIVILVRRSNHGSQVGTTHTTSVTRDLSLAFLLVAGSTVGVMALYQSPVRLFGAESNGSSAFIVRLVAGFAVLLAGLLLDGLMRYYLLITSTLVLLMSSIYIFTNLGSAGALVALVVAMIVLIGVTIRLSKKGSIRAGGDGVRHE